MSALGQKQTSAHVRVMSALPPKADMDRACRDVRFVPKADVEPHKKINPLTDTDTAAFLTQCSDLS
jgi:hypothetical protein